MKQLKINKAALLGSLVALTFNAFTQDKDIVFETSREFEYHFGEPYPVVDARVKNYVSKDGNIISFKMEKDFATIQKFDGPNFSQTSINTYEDFPKGTVYEDQIELDDFVYILFSAWDKSNSTEQLFVRKVNKSTGQFEGPEERLIAVEGKITGGDGNKFKLARSFDQSKILIQYRRKPETKKDKLNKDVIGLYTFTKELSLVWGKDVEMPYSEAQMENIDYAIDKDANVFILAEVLKGTETENSLKGKNANLEYEIVAIRESGTSLVNTPISAQGKFINQVKFFEGNNNSLLIAGFYSNVIEGLIDGIFFCTIDKDLNQTGLKSVKIPSEIIKQFNSEKTQKKIEKAEEEGNNIGLKDFVLRQIKIDADGSILFVGEKYYYFIRVHKDAGDTYNYYYEEMLAAKIAPDGSIIFIKKLPKRQFANSPNPPSRFNTLGMDMLSKVFDGESLGYHLIESSEYYYFLFLDNIKNLELEENKAPEYHENGHGGFLTAYQVNKKSGAVKKLSILDTRDAKEYDLHQFKPTRIVEVGNNEFALECYIKKKQDIMIRIKVLE
ncbi:hypothetical protein [Fluviicola sp.]|uniref:hypothetical protein n=1 Tax=Fluviicola sp. TaxID=1917219 RepID=UPI0031E3DAEB